MLTSAEYGELALEYRQVCEDQRQAARTAADFESINCPLLAESYHNDSRRLHARIWELLPLLQEYEARVRGAA